MYRLCISPWNFNTKFSPTYPWYNVHIMARARYLHSELSGHEKYRITAKVTEVLMWNLAPDYTHRAQLVYSRTRHKECSRRQLRENPYKLKQCVNASTLWIINTRGSSTLWITRNVNCGKELDKIFFNQQLDEKECNKQVHVHCPSNKSLLYHHLLNNNNLNQFSCLKLKLARDKVANAIFVAYSNCCVSCTIFPHT